MSTIADLVIKLSANTGAAEKDITSFAGRVGKGFNKMLLPATAALGLAAVGAKKVVDSASDMNETVSKTGVVFGPATKSVIKFGEGSARALGISKKEALDAASTYGTFGKAAGKTGKALSDFSLPLVKAASDLASFHNVPVAQALEDIRSGLAGETEPLRKYGILLNDAALRQQALKMGLVKTTKDALSPQNKMLAAQQLILHKLGPAHNDFARTASSAANQERIQAAESANLSAKLGAGLLPAYQGLQRILLSVTGFMASHTGLVKVAVAALVALAAVVVTVNAAMAFWKATQLASAAVTKVLTAETWSLNAAFAANPIGLVVIALVALGVALYMAWTKSETFRKVVTDAWNAIKSVTMTVFNFIRDHIKTIMAAVLVIMTGGLGAIVLLVIAKWGAIKSTTIAVWNAIKSVVTTVVGAIKGAVSTGFGALSGIASTTLNAVKSTVSTVWNGIKTVVTGVVDAIKTAVRTGFSALSGIIRGVVGAIRGAVALIKGALQPIIDVLHGIESAAHAAGSALSALSKAAGAVKGLGGHLNPGGGIPFIGGHARGGLNLPGGTALVGERGPELVNLPKGSSVFSNYRSQKMLGAGGDRRDAPLIGEVHVHNDTDVEVLARRIERLLAFGH